MLEIIHGQTKHQVIAEHLVAEVSRQSLNGTLYIGYPVIATADDKVEVDALLICREKGLVAFSFVSAANISGGLPHLAAQQDQLYFALQNNLSRHEGLRNGRNLAMEIRTVTLFPTAPTIPNGVLGTFLDVAGLDKYLSNLSGLDAQIYKQVEAALQRVTTIKPIKKRNSVTMTESMGAILREMEKEISNLDQWQKKAAIESPEGPQRIRGLAGSGKTIVLALKAAYLHAQHPDWKIAVTYYSRSLYQQFRDLIRRFSYEHLNDEPNWDNLKVLHSWGGTEREGVYSEMANAINSPVRDFLYARTKFGMDGAFEGICNELIAITNNSEPEPIYDAILVDEAQDLPPVFFQLIYKFTKAPKRIVWAYDELQKLSEAVMSSTEDLFGREADGTARVNLSNIPGQARQDVMLPVCYRNSPWALSLAHSLGFGLNRKVGLVQHFDDPAAWSEVGYEVVEGALELGRDVTIKRSPISYPPYFPRLLQSSDAVVWKALDSEIEQAEWVAAEIAKNLTQGELEHDDIFIVLPDAFTAKKRAPRIQLALSRLDIPSHVVGVTSSRDEVFRKGSIAIAHIFRSKGNEAPMVYALDCQFCFTGHELIKIRNTLFTAITRSRGWVRLVGFGPNMVALTEEICAVQSKDYRLKFKIPTAPELKRMRMINRDRTGDEKARIKKAERGLDQFLEAVRHGDLSVENLPLDVKAQLAELLAAEQNLDE